MGICAVPTTRFRYRRILEALDRHAVQHIKAAAGRPKDVAVLPILRQTLAETRRPRGA